MKEICDDKKNHSLNVWQRRNLLIEKFPILVEFS